MFELDTPVLVIDPLLMMRKLVSKTCKEIGFTQIIEADDGTKGWELINDSNPPFGLIISEWDMPNCTGIDLLKRVRADARFQTLPFMLVTAGAEQNQIMEALKSGVSSYLVKPFTVETLKEKIEQIHQRLSAGK